MVCHDMWSVGALSLAKQIICKILIIHLFVLFFLTDYQLSTTDYFMHVMRLGKSPKYANPHVSTVSYVPQAPTPCCRRTGRLCVL